MGRLDEIERFREIERAAGAPFRDLGMARIADDEPPGADALALRVRADRLWVFADAKDIPVAYLMADPLGSHAHIEQVSVHPDVARRGLGAVLIEQAGRWGVSAGLADLTLCTFVGVAWNAPYYARLGFRAVPDDELDGRLAALRRHEGELGLDQWPRTVMVRSLTRTQ
ncbi:MAG: family acetyltransferase [Pseudonocardiales bacterium]|nr:family acetyltransferase [Pseudonocardiales bacterium]